MKSSCNEVDAKLVNSIIHGDCLEKLKFLPDNSIDMIFADPPYSLQLDNDLYRPNQSLVNSVNDKWDKFSSFKMYDNFSTQWLRECHRVLKENGTIWVIGSYHNIFRIGSIIQDIGFWILNDIIWIKSNPMPNFKGTRFNNAHETLIWAAKSKKSNYTFHYKSMKTFNDDLQMRSDWYLPICSGKERLKKDGKKVHSTQKPLELLNRVILSSSNIGDLILDPFMGSGTTAAAAKLLNRNYIGIEKEELYIEEAEKRIDSIKPIDNRHLCQVDDIKPPRVPIGSLIEDGMINIGEQIYSKDKNFSATVLASGTLITNNSLSGSIHSLSAKLIGKQANNGWKFWYIIRDGNLISIDQLRDDYISKYNLSGI
jgi:DNA modification methylase